MARRRKTPQPNPVAKPTQAGIPHVEPAQARPTAAPQPAIHAEPRPALPRPRPSILVVIADRTAAARMVRHIEAAFPGAAVSRRASLAAARNAIDQLTPDLALVAADLPDGSGFDFADELTVSRTCAAVICSDDPTAQQALHALRVGALDLLPLCNSADETANALTRALARTEAMRRREDRIRRLTHICRRLNWSRREMSKHISGLCGDMINAFQEMADQVNQITIASEFNGLIRQELDVEALLRTALEYILAKCGSTNAAVFLPAGSQDFSLGAYVNYDCPKDALDMMLEHLAGILAPRIAGDAGMTLPADESPIRVLSTEEDLVDLLGDDAHWLADSGAVTFACRHQGECLAVVILFRDRRTPFTESSLDLLSIISTVFAQQLARIVRIHHRHLPKDQWGAWGGMGMADDGDDDLDLAA